MHGRSPADVSVHIQAKSQLFEGSSNTHLPLPNRAHPLNDIAIMPRPTARTEVLARLRQSLKDGKILVGAGAGSRHGSRLVDTDAWLMLSNRHWPLREMSRGRWSRSHPRLQFGPLPYGWQGISCGHDAVQRRERRRRGDGMSCAQLPLRHDISPYIAG